eukprot:Skav200168  [mRNA]  locus=scaffold6219:84741:88121:- [translate_table: standard]
MSAPSPILLGRTTCSQPSAAGKGQDEPGEGSAATGHTDHQIRRSQHVEGRKQRRSWKWTFFQWSCSLVVVVLSIWLALTLGIPPYDCAHIVVPRYGDYGKVACAWYERRHSYWDGAFTYLETTMEWDPNVGYVRVSEEKVIVFPDSGFRDDPRFFALVISTALSGLAAIWMWLAAPTIHILLASYFLMLNWLEGLVTLSLLVCVIYFYSGTRHFGTDASKEVYIPVLVLGILRFLLLLSEFITLQYVAQHRLKHIWPALNRARCGKCLGGSFWLQVVLILSALILWLSAIQVNQSCEDLKYKLDKLPAYGYGSAQFEEMQDLRNACPNKFSTIVSLSLWFACLVPVCFLIWFLVVVSTLCRSTLILQRSFRFGRKLDGRTLAATRLWVSLRGLLLQTLGLLAGLVTTLAFSHHVLPFYLHGASHLPSVYWKIC